MGIRSSVKGLLKQGLKWAAGQAASRLREGVDLTSEVQTPPASRRGTVEGRASHRVIQPPVPGGPHTNLTGGVSPAVPAPVPAPQSPAARVVETFDLFARVRVDAGGQVLTGEVYDCVENPDAGAGPLYDILITDASGRPRVLRGLSGQVLSVSG